MLVLVVAGLAIGLVSCVRSCNSKTNETPAEKTQANTKDETATATEKKEEKESEDVPDEEKAMILKLGATDMSGVMRFCAVGDNLANDNILEAADSWSGEIGDGSYDFTPLYQDIRSAIMSYDVSFINQETTLGGTDDYEISGYPSYNTPDSMADAVANTGFRVVNLNTNHTYDFWTDNIKHGQMLWESKESLLTIGSYVSAEDRARVRVVQRNGVRIAFLSYGYGQNGYEQSDLPNDYYAVPYDATRLAEEVAKAREVADAVVVYMHWGDEYVNEPSEDQLEWAQVCADNNVDVVIGSHVHVIQPIRWIERADGGKMLCAFGMGDFVSGYTDYPDTILSGMVSCDFVRGSGGAVTVSNVMWHPLIEHRVTNEDGTIDDRVIMVRNYTEEMAAENELLSSLVSEGTDPYKWITQKTREIIAKDDGDHEGIEIDT